MEKSNYTEWTYDMKLKLALAVDEFQAHLTTANMSKESKWASILIELQNLPQFTDTNGLSKLQVKKSDALKNAFYRFRDKELKDVTVQATNLSGMPAVPSELRKLMGKLFKEEQLERDKKKQQKDFNAFEKKRNELMASELLTHSSNLGSTNLREVIIPEEAEVNISSTSESSNSRSNSTNSKFASATKSSKPSLEEQIENSIAKFVEASQMTLARSPEMHQEKQPSALELLQIQQAKEKHEMEMSIFRIKRDLLLNKSKKRKHDDDDDDEYFSSLN